MNKARRHKVLIVGGGTAGISVAARLRRAGVDDIGLIDPAEKHYYQPLWTLVGGGLASAEETERDQRDVMPAGVTWIQQSAIDIQPDENLVVLGDSSTVEYDYLVVCPGIQLDWDATPGLVQTLGKDGVSSNYRYDLAPKTWEFIKDMRSGTALFTMPAGPIKCAGAPQKIAYLAADWWRKQGVLDNINLVLVLPTPGMFGVKVFSDALYEVAQGYGIDVRFSSEVTALDPANRTATISPLENGEDTTLQYDMVHFTPKQSAPDWIKKTSLADPANPAGYVDIDQHTMQHVRYPNIFALGDAGSSPNSKTGAAIRKQAPVVVENLRKVMAGASSDGRYSGYASCPLTTARNRMLLAEFDYTMEPTPSIPFIDTTKPRYDMWLLKRRGLPFLYWNFILKGRA